MAQNGVFPPGFFVGDEQKRRYMIELLYRVGQRPGAIIQTTGYKKTQVRQYKKTLQFLKK